MYVDWAPRHKALEPTKIENAHPLEDTAVETMVLSGVHGMCS
jgi:hypothetical protein